jgi:hypothetical protein
MVRPNIVRILEWDPRHHEELWNGMGNKIHIRESDFRVLEKFGFSGIGEVLEGSERATSGAHTSRVAHMDQVVVPRPTWAWGISPTRSMRPA